MMRSNPENRIRDLTTYRHLSLNQYAQDHLRLSNAPRVTRERKNDCVHWLQHARERQTAVRDGNWESHNLSGFGTVTLDAAKPGQPGS